MRTWAHVCRVRPLPTECKMSSDMLHNICRPMLLSMLSLLMAAQVRQAHQRQTGSAREKRLRWLPLGRCPQAARPASCLRRCCNSSRSTSAASPAPGAPAAGERSGWRAPWLRPSHKSAASGRIDALIDCVAIAAKTLHWLCVALRGRISLRRGFARGSSTAHACT